MRTEKVLGILFVVLATLNLLSIHGSAALLVVVLSTLALMYFPLAFYFFSDRSLKNQNLLFSIVSGFFLSISPVGILFKLLYWAGAEPMLVIGLTAGILIFAAAYFLKKNSKPELITYYNNMLKRTTVIVTVSAIVCLLPYSLLLNIEHRNDPELARLKIQLHENPRNEEYRQQLDNYVKKEK